LRSALTPKFKFALDHTVGTWCARVLIVLAPVVFILIAGASAKANTYTVTKTSMGGSSAGRLDTAINNANSNAGADTIAFNIPSSDAGYDATRGVWKFTLTAALPVITGPTIIDGTTQTTNQGNTNATTLGTGGTVGVDAISLPTVAGPEIEITTSVTGSSIIGLNFSTTATGSTVKGLAIYGFNDSLIYALGANFTLDGCVMGTKANSFTDNVTTGRGGVGIWLEGNSAIIQNSLFGFSINYGPYISQGTGTTVNHCEIRQTSNGGIATSNSSTSTILQSLITAHSGAGISGGSSATNNTISNNGTSSSSQGRTGITATNTSSIDRNIITGNGAAGIAIMSSVVNSTITKNSIYSNGTANSEIGIDLLVDFSENANGTSPFVTLNDSGDGDTGGNNLLNYPILNTALISGSNMTITGWARPGAAIELFIAESPADASGFGEGKTYLTTLTEGSGADTDATSSTYGPGAINGISQGTDTTNRFSFTIATPGGVTAGTKLTATATISNNTSEFSGNVTAALVYTISGYIQNASGTAISLVTLTLSGSQSGSTTTDASGNYTLANLTAGGNYTITPSLTNYTFSATSRTYNALAAKQTAADFTGTSTITYTISGRIQNATGTAISGVTVTLSGGQAGSTTTDGNGDYSFAGLPSTNNYTVTPSKTNYTFSAPSLTYTNLGANQTAQNFTGTSTVTYTISGHIQNASAAPINGVTVTLSGGQAGSTTTDASGNYSFAGLPSTNYYIVTPSLTNYTFSATSRTYNDLAANQTAADFTGTSTIVYQISGTILNASGIRISGVTVSLSGGQSALRVTDACCDNYAFTNLPSTNTYTVTPSKLNYTFSPTSRTYNNLSAAQTTADFIGTSTVTYTISGHIQNASAIAVSAVTVTLSGGQAGSTTTDGSGNYLFAGLPSTNNYTVTPSLTSYTFSATSRTYNALAANQAAADFTGTLAGYTISGHIADIGSTAISGVTVTLSGGQTGTTNTDASGNYSFASLTTGLNYTVTPSKTDYAFSPPSRTFNNLSAAQVADFIAALIPNVTLTASVSPTGTVQPRTDLVYTISFSNNGAGSASAFVITDPIPTNTDFKLSSMTTSLGTTGLTPTLAYSNDGGVTWTYTPSSGGGGAPSGYDRDVTDVRWSFAGSLSQTSPNNTGSVAFTARIP
jgi:uncharacterized repeat protein (TIGR01451 family)